MKGILQTQAHLLFCGNARKQARRNSYVVPIARYEFSEFIVRVRQIAPKRSLHLRGTLRVGRRTFGGFLGLPESQPVFFPGREQSHTRQPGRGVKPAKLVRLRERRNRSAAETSKGAE